MATDMVIGGEVDNAFCNVRSPGHHATRDQSMGFCIINVPLPASTHGAGFRAAFMARCLLR